MMPEIGFASMAIGVLASVELASAQEADTLSSWSDNASRQAIVEFVENVTRTGGPDFVPPAERIAVFDNDGRQAPVRSGGVDLNQLTLSRWWRNWLTRPLEVFDV